MKSGKYEWVYSGCTQTRVKATYLPSSELIIAVWRNNNLANPNIVLCLDLLISHVNFRDLTGNGIGGVLNRKGLGTFVVNISIQVLQATRDPDTPVTGALFHGQDSSYPKEKQECLADGRRRFWKRFGLSIEQAGSVHKEMITGTVGQLTTYPKGLVDDQFPVLVPFSEFSFGAL